MIRPPPRSTLFPSTTLFRSSRTEARRRSRSQASIASRAMTVAGRLSEIGRAHVSTTVTPTPPIPSSFFLNDTATTEIYTLSLHDALPIFPYRGPSPLPEPGLYRLAGDDRGGPFERDRKSTRLNYSHAYTSYSLFFFFK